MPVDLDDLFATLGRHADTIPLATAGSARQRGRQRTRTRALVAAAAAVCLVAAGTGAALHRQEHEAAPVLAPVGSPIEFGGQARSSSAVGADGRLYTAWQTLDGRIRMTAAELSTGARAWPVREIGRRTDTLRNVSAVAPGVVVVLGHANGVSPDSTLYFFDPADGRQRWSVPIDARDDLVPHTSGLVLMSAATGRTESLDWATGAKRWELPPPADRPVRTLGTYRDENWALVLGRPITFTDDRLVQVTAAGKVQVRDIATGALRHTVVSVPPDKDPRTFLAYGDRLYNDEHECCDNRGYRIRMTDLSSARGGSTVVRTGSAGHEVEMLQACGDQRVCVSDQDRGGEATVTVLDRATGRQVWQVPAPDGAYAATVPGYTLIAGPEGDRVIYDRDGRRVWTTSAASVDWLDADTLLLLPTFQDGPVSKVSMPDGKVTVLGDAPPASDACVTTPERLACPVITSLRIWRLTG
ncbi:hypothetical protein GCM10020358_15990 [Amorphoplanes nipponensis]|uniref:Pyrrolo-quinoline quinone repeat domain-containing protein n=1 Tax=Actinoplanes nipponensis TaxID=135950 RepID=A0A919JKY0_9ACTN|nr:PQQ-binding-like beta-propeller repeat protein [Actinoplanes nipponensis]GIE52904.1 hypothetical protein Ani05nite_64380 [Actinoplanes nipponensis]